MLCTEQHFHQKKGKWLREEDKKCEVKLFEKRTSRKIRLKGVTQELLFVTIHLFTRKITLNDISEMKYLTYKNFSIHLECR